MDLGFPGGHICVDSAVTPTNEPASQPTNGRSVGLEMRLSRRYDTNLPSHTTAQRGCTERQTRLM